MRTSLRPASSMIQKRVMRAARHTRGREVIENTEVDLRLRAAMGLNGTTCKRTRRFLSNSCLRARDSEQGMALCRTCHQQPHASVSQGGVKQHAATQRCKNYLLLECHCLRAPSECRGELEPGAPKKTLGKCVSRIMSSTVVFGLARGVEVVVEEIPRNVQVARKLGDLAAADLVRVHEVPVLRLAQLQCLPARESSESE